MSLDTTVSTGEQATAPHSARKARWNRDKVYTNLSYLTMILPGAIWLLLFSYLPMPGIILAFKEYKLSRPPADYWIQNKFIYSLITSQKH